MVGAYTYSHLIERRDCRSLSTVLSPRRSQDGLNLNRDFANSILDHRHRFTLSIVYDEPFFKNGKCVPEEHRGRMGKSRQSTPTSPVSGSLPRAESTRTSTWIPPEIARILNPSGVKGTGSGTSPLCRSAVPSAACTNANLFCTGDPTVDGAGCPVGVNVIGNVVGYAPVNANAQYLTANYGALATVGRNTLQLKPINDVDVSALSVSSSPSGSKLNSALRQPTFSITRSTSADISTTCSRRTGVHGLSKEHVVAQ